MVLSVSTWYQSSAFLDRRYNIVAGDENKKGNGQDFEQLVNKHSSPYYLFSADQLGACIVFKISTGQQNFYDWEKAMIVSIDSWKKLGFVDDNLKRSTFPCDEQEVWDTYNNLVLSWIYNSVDLEISATLISTSSAFATLL